MTGEPPGRLSRRGLLGAVSAGLTALAGCGYRPGGGDVRWEFETGTGPFGSDDLLAADGVVFTVTRSARGFDWETEEWGDMSTVTAYDATSGARGWDRDGQPVGQPATDARAIYLGDESGTLTALGTDGRERWQQSVGDFPRTVAAGGGRVYALTASGELSAHAAEDGETAWSVTLDAGEASRLAPTGDGVVVHRGDGKEVAFYRGGERRWDVALPDGSGHWDARPTVADGTVYFHGGRGVVACSLSDGSVRWVHEDVRPNGPIAVGDDTVYFVSNHALHAVDAADGDARWSTGTGEASDVDLTSPPAFAGGTVYAGTGDSLVAMSADDGSVRWRVEGERVTARPLVVGSTVVVSVAGAIRAHWRE